MYCFNDDTGTTFIPSEYASVFATVIPILVPVNDPGPIVTNILSISDIFKLFLGNQKSGGCFRRSFLKSLYLRALRRLGFCVHLTTKSHRTRG